MELLWRRGHVDPSVSKLPNYEECLEVSKNISIFANELSEIEINMNKVDIEVIFTPKVHCVLAGRGTEFLCGVAKLFFRRQNAELDNDERVNDLKPGVEKKCQKCL